jgi:hypothetical protein
LPALKALAANNPNISPTRPLIMPVYVAQR